MSALCSWAAGLGKTVFKQLVIGHFLIKIGCLNMFRQLLYPTLLGSAFSTPKLSVLVKVMFTVMAKNPLLADHGDFSCCLWMTLTARNSHKL
jgi:hypothetical protein